MHVKQVGLKCFMSHADSALALPERGLVLVTGANGSGKSSVVEAVATALWGKTLRDASPWQDGQDCEASVVADVVEASRLRFKDGRTVLAWRTDPAQNLTAGPSTTKAQMALNAVVGDFEVWRRTHVFSSTDAAHFTLATDGERKRLLEALLGLDKFDAALASCREDLREVIQRRGKAEDEKMWALRSLEEAQVRLAAAVTRTAEVPAQPVGLLAPAQVDAAQRRVKQLTATLDDIKQDAQVRLGESRQTGAVTVEEATYAKVLEDRLNKLSSPACPTCGQSVPDALRQKLWQEAQDLRAAAQKKVLAADAKLRLLDADYESLRNDAREAEAALECCRADLRKHAEAVRCKAQLDGWRDQVTGARQDAEKHVAAAQETAAVARTTFGHECGAAALLEAVERVLGLRGVRAHVLGRALGGLEAAANIWLARVAGEGLRLKLAPYVEKKTGGVSDAIGLEIVGRGGKTYKSCSGGERRRIDVALLFALSEVAAAAHGTGRGTIWADECFDALDQDGVEHVTRALEDLAKDRAVVVISHSDSLVAGVLGATRIRVADGVLT